MNAGKIQEVVDKYRLKLLSMMPDVTRVISRKKRIGLLRAIFLRSAVLHHCYDMLDNVEIHLKTGRLEKAFRWLGFIQGVFWVLGLYSIEELKKHSMPSGIKKHYLNIFLICPVRNITPEIQKQIATYVQTQEQNGNFVHWPLRDTNQDDSVGLRICNDNLSAMKNADEVHVYWNDDSKGSLFDLGMALALNKKIVLVNPGDVPRTALKSFHNVLLALNSAK